MQPPAFSQLDDVLINLLIEYLWALHNSHTDQEAAWANGIGFALRVLVEKEVLKKAAIFVDGMSEIANKGLFQRDLRSYLIAEYLSAPS